MTPILHLLQLTAHQFAAVTLTVTPQVDYAYIAMCGSTYTSITYTGQNVVLPKVEPGLYLVYGGDATRVFAKTIRVQPGSNSMYRLDLETVDTSKTRVFGCLIEPISREPAGGFTITSSDGHSTTTADDGTFLMVNMDRGTQTFTALYKDSVVAVSEVTLTSGGKQVVMKLGVTSRLPAITDGLVAYYPFTNGEMQDSSGYNTHGKNLGGASVADRHGNPSNAMGFSGTNRAEIPDALWQHQLPMSISFWIKADKKQNGPSIVLAKFSSELTGWMINFSDKNLFVSSTRDWNGWTTSIVSTDIPFNSSWHHCVVTMDENQVVLHIDGSKRQGKVYPNEYSRPKNNDPICLGRIPQLLGPASPGFVGTIDELAFYNRVLNDNEVMLLRGE